MICSLFDFLAVARDAAPGGPAALHPIIGRKSNAAPQKKRAPGMPGALVVQAQPRV